MSIYWKAENWIGNDGFEKPKLKYWNLKAEAGKFGSKSGNVEIESEKLNLKTGFLISREYFVEI